MSARGFQYKHGFKADCERKAIFFRKKLGLKSYSPLSARKLAGLLKIDLVIPADFKQLPKKTVRGLYNSNEWSAICMDTASGLLIIHNNRHSKPRQESNLMHEMAHIICNHSFEGMKINHDGILLRNYNTEHEKEAEWLGACLQLNRDSLEWALRRRMKVTEIMTKFTASRQMVSYRLRMSGVLHQFKYFDPLD